MQTVRRNENVKFCRPINQIFSIFCTLLFPLWFRRSIWRMIWKLWQVFCSTADFDVHKVQWTFKPNIGLSIGVGYRTKIDFKFQFKTSFSNSNVWNVSKWKDIFIRVIDWDCLYSTIWDEFLRITFKVTIEIYNRMMSNLLKERLVSKGNKG